MAVKLQLLCFAAFVICAQAQNVGPLGSEIKWIGALAWGAITLIAWGIALAFMATDWELWVSRGRSGKWRAGIIGVSLLSTVAMFLGIAGITIAWASLGQARNNGQTSYSVSLALYCAYLGFFIMFGFCFFNRRSLAWGVIFWLATCASAIISLVFMWWLSRTAFGIFFFLPVWLVLVGIILFVVHRKNRDYTSGEVLKVHHEDHFSTSSGDGYFHHHHHTKTTAETESKDPYEVVEWT